MAALRGITSRVDIIGGGALLRRTNNIPPTMMASSVLYTDTYTISHLE